MPLNEKGKRHSEKRHRCVEHVMEKGYPSSSAWPICVASVKDGEGPSCGDSKMYDSCSAKKKDYKDSVSVTFADRATWDGGSKSAISVRDGVLEYLGSEIGMEPPEKMFKIYRSPATIASAAIKMRGIPLTDEHVEIGSKITDGCGQVKESEVIDFFEDGTDSRLAIKNIVDISAELLDTLSNGKKELSLGYSADLVPHDKYDYEQRNIEPHHLALVMAGRCGHGCKFIDKKGTSMSKQKMFFDAEGMPNLEQIAEVAMALPEALKAMPIDQLQEIIPQLQAIVESAKAASGEPMPEAGDEVGPDGELAGEGALDESMPEDAVEEEIKDEEMKEDEKKVDVKDSSEFKDAVASAVAEYASVISKAVDFVDDGYIFTGKTAHDIMSDVVATKYDVKTLDSNEIKVAFKLMKKESNYKNFGDNASDDAWSTVGKKEIK